ncbi:hypothetical protein BHE74_00007110 [Ensete ventricosum]|nr:hypothetical protein BHE74_00007110 [Ensete ventricosum]
MKTISDHGLNTLGAYRPDSRGGWKGLSKSSPGFPTPPSTQTKIFLQIREKGVLKAPNPMRTRPEEHDRGCYYHFHRDYGNDTEECYDLKNQIEDLIRRSHLDRFVRKPREPSPPPKGPVERQIDIIVGGSIVGGDSSSTRKAYTRAEVQKRPRVQRDPEITFKSENEYSDHDEALKAHYKLLLSICTVKRLSEVDRHIAVLGALGEWVRLDLSLQMLGLESLESHVVSELVADVHHLLEARFKLSGSFVGSHHLWSLRLQLLFKESDRLGQQEHVLLEMGLVVPGPLQARAQGVNLLLEVLASVLRGPQLDPQLVHGRLQLLRLMLGGRDYLLASPAIQSTVMLSCWCRTSQPKPWT